MRQFLIRGLLIFFGFSVSFAAFAATEYSWRQRIHKDGITVYTRKVDGSRLLEFKAGVRINAPIEKVVSIFEDPKKMTQWYHQCVYSKVLEDEGPLQKMCYIVLHLPWPVSERDCVFRLTKEEDPKSGVLSYTLIAFANHFPIQRGMIRVPYLKAVWRLTPFSHDQTEVFVQQHSDPGGVIPVFLANKLVVDIPFVSLKNLRELVSLKQWQ